MCSHQMIENSVGADVIIRIDEGPENLVTPYVYRPELVLNTTTQEYW